ncbi:MAG: M1 family metallopeptidase [Corallococcus sp.]|nr:M1 family metallopeptidase [Corallococcus sp.]
MKKFLCITLCLILLCGIFVLAACGTDKMKQIAKKCDTYTIAAAYDADAHILSATQITDMTNRSGNGFDSVKFHLYANQYREDASNGVVPKVYYSQAYPNGNSYGDITLDSVKVNDVAVAFTIEGDDMDILSVPLANTLLPDQSVSIEMTYQISLANIMHRLGYTENTVNLGNFYPILCRVDNDNYVCSPYYNVGDPFVSETANYKVSLTVPKKYVVASSGNLADTSTEGNDVTYNYNATAVRDFAMVISDKYKTITQTVGDTQVNYYYYNDADCETSLATACGMMEFLNKNVGTYPYEQYSVCETDFCYGGMEYPCLAMVTSGSSSYREAVAHETAHQWFYGLVGNDQIADAWMDEGLAEFLTYLYLDKNNGAPLSQNILANTKTYTTYVDVLNRYYDNVDTSMRSVDKYKNDSEYVIFTYVKGSLLFNTVYETLGETKFFKALSKYFDEALFTIAAPDQLVNSFAQVGGTETAAIINSFIEGKEIIGKVTDK